jgi:excisionase family DNA binding protein
MEEIEMTTSKFARRSGTPAQDPDGTSPRSLKLLSVQECADYARVSTQTVRRAITAGHLKTYRAGKQIRIDEIDLVQYLSL